LKPALQGALSLTIISVVIPTRKRPKLVERAVRSALAQTLHAIEVIVVIDGEDWATECALEPLARQDARLRVLALPYSLGGSDARNRGVEAACGEWIAFLDDDDEWFPGKLEAQVEAVGRSAAPAVIGTCKMIARTPHRDYVWPRRMPDRNEQLGEYILARRSFTRGEGYIQTSTLLVRRTLMVAHPFKSGQLKHQDTEWVLRLGRLPGVEVVFADEVLAIHNIEEDRPTVSNQANWRYSLEWSRRDRPLFTPRALSSFLLFQIAAEASDQGAWRAFYVLPIEALRHGKTRLFDFVIFLAIWLVPRRSRRRLRDWVARRNLLRSMVPAL
jgi:glycosyltransferase involved in cell wall biosynthesis